MKGKWLGGLYKSQQMGGTTKVRVCFTSSKNRGNKSMNDKRRSGGYQNIPRVGRKRGRKGGEGTRLKRNEGEASTNLCSSACSLSSKSHPLSHPRRNTQLELSSFLPPQAKATLHSAHPNPYLSTPTTFPSHLHRYSSPLPKFLPQNLPSSAIPPPTSPAPGFPRSNSSLIPSHPSSALPENARINIAVCANECVGEKPFFASPLRHSILVRFPPYTLF